MTNGTAVADAETIRSTVLMAVLHGEPGLVGLILFILHLFGRETLG